MDQEILDTTTLTTTLDTTITKHLNNSDSPQRHTPFALRPRYPRSHTRTNHDTALAPNHRPDFHQPTHTSTHRNRRFTHLFPGCFLFPGIRHHLYFSRIKARGGGGGGGGTLFRSSNHQLQQASKQAGENIPAWSCLVSRLPLLLADRKTRLNGRNTMNIY